MGIKVSFQNTSEIFWGAIYSEDTYREVIQHSPERVSTCCAVAETAVVGADFVSNMGQIFSRLLVQPGLWQAIRKED